MLFDSPQWTILPAYVPQKWGNTSNSVKVCPLRGRAYDVLATIPTGLQSIFKDTLHILPEDAVWLFLEEVEGDGWYLRAQWEMGSLPSADLWRTAEIPNWADKKYALKW